MRSGRTVVVVLLVLCGLAAWPAAGRAQTQPDVGVAPAVREAPVAVGGLILPGTALQPSGGRVLNLSVDEAVTRALEQNVDLRVERLNPQIQDMSVAEARSVYAPTLTTAFFGNNADSPAAGFLSGAGDQNVVTDRFVQDTVGVNQLVPWLGGSYSASWDGSRATSNSIFSSFDPRLRSNLRLSYSQPLLRNFGIDTPRQQIEITRANRELSDIQLRRTVVLTQRNVRNAYWQLVFTQDFLIPPSRIPSRE